MLSLKQELEAEFDVFIKINVSSVNGPHLLWDANKGCIRNKTISFASKPNKTRKNRIESLEIAVVDNNSITITIIHLKIYLSERG